MGPRQILDAFVIHEQLVGYSPRTVERRASTVALFWGHLGEARANRDSVEAFLVSRRAQETRRSYLGDLRRFYGWAIDRGHAGSDPTDGIQTPRVPTRDPSPLSGPDVELVRAGCRNRQDRLVIGLGLFAGLRISEMAALEHRDVRLGEMVLVVRAGKGGRDRRIPLAPALVDDLALEVVAASTRAAVGDRIRRVYRRVGVVARPHDLRHTFATELARCSGGDVTLVAALCGHRSFATTRRYVGWAPTGGDVVGKMFGVS